MPKTTRLQSMRRQVDEMQQLIDWLHWLHTNCNVTADITFIYFGLTQTVRTLIRMTIKCECFGLWMLVWLLFLDNDCLYDCFFWLMNTCMTTFSTKLYYCYFFGIKIVWMKFMFSCWNFVSNESVVIVILWLFFVFIFEFIVHVMAEYVASYNPRWLRSMHNSSI